MSSRLQLASMAALLMLSAEMAKMDFSQPLDPPRLRIISQKKRRRRVRAGYAIRHRRGRKMAA